MEHEEHVRIARGMKGSRPENACGPPHHRRRSADVMPHEVTTPRHTSSTASTAIAIASTGLRRGLRDPGGDAGAGLDG